MACIVCEKIKERKAIIAYEDKEIIAILPGRPAVLGHVKIFPKSHFSKIDEMPSSLVESLFFVGNLLSTAAFEVVRAQGTNLLLNETDEHIVLDVIPRKEKDGLNFGWQPKQSSPEDLDTFFSKIKDKMFGVGKVENKPAVLVDLDKKRPVEEIKVDIEAPDETPAKPEVKPKEETNYLIKQLTRIP